ncbi:MAG: CD1871A family CXXC motif-containing protein [Anaerovoracaceae bacterium]
MNYRDEFHNSFKYIILFASILFIVWGVFREEHLTVLRKAVNICLECIGIG